MATHALNSPKKCEHDPLLRVGGSVEGGKGPLSVVTAPPKRSYGKWPEIMSACWMTVALLCICCLTLYVLGVVLTKRQGLVIQYMKEREPRHQHEDPTKNVYYHHIVERGLPVDFIMFSSYLGKMATLYQSLNFNVFFLTADPVRRISPKQRRGRLTQLLVPTFVSSWSPKMNEENVRELGGFLKVHRNVNVSIVPLGRHMASTPLRDKWRGSPPTWIAFYARVVSVWRYGGIGVDLASANAEYLTHSRPDPRKTAVFIEHNGGTRDSVHLETTRDMMRRMQSEDLPVLLYLFKFITDLFDRSMLPLFGNTTSITIIDQNDSAISRTSVNKTAFGVKFSNEEPESNYTIETQSNDSNIPFMGKPVMNHKIEIENVKNLTPDSEETKFPATSNTPRGHNQTDFVPNGDYEMLPPIFLYRFSLSSDDAGSTYGSYKNPAYHAKPYRYPEVNNRKNDNRRCALTLDWNGNFISSLSRFHPLLGHIVYANFRPVSPRLAVEDALLAHCSVSYDNYCKYISLI